MSNTTIGRHWDNKLRVWIDHAEEGFPRQLPLFPPSLPLLLVAQVIAENPMTSKVWKVGVHTVNDFLYCLCSWKVRQSLGTKSNPVGSFLLPKIMHCRRNPIRKAVPVVALLEMNWNLLNMDLRNKALPDFF